MNYIGDRISYQSKNNIFSVVIAASVERSKESLLAAWLFCWSLCGLYFIYQLFSDLPRETKMYIMILLAFWGYYELRVFRMFMWRKFGYESIKFIDDKLVIKDVVKGHGKEKSYFIDNIAQIGRLKLENNWMKTMDQSFWVKGTGILQFEYQGKLVGFAKQIGDKESNALLAVMQKELAERKKTLKNVE